MEEFLRDLFESDISGAHLGHAVPVEIRNMMVNRDELYEKLREILGEENFRLLEKYDSLNGLISDEERFYTFLCGIELFSKFFRSLFRS